MPYPGITNKETIDRVLQGYRMEPPSNCPLSIAEIMKSSWSHQPENRPSFKVIQTKILQLRKQKLNDGDQLDQLNSAHYELTDGMEPPKEPKAHMS